jgi:hypothetical protein
MPASLPVPATLPPRSDHERACFIRKSGSNQLRGDQAETTARTEIVRAANGQGNAGTALPRGFARQRHYLINQPTAARGVVSEHEVVLEEIRRRTGGHDGPDASIRPMSNLRNLE